MREKRAAWMFGGVAAVIVIAVAGYGAALILAGSSRAETGAIAGSVGPGTDISIAPSGPFTAGEYAFSVNDQAPDHNFHLVGPGVDLATSVDATGTTSWTVTLAPGDYQFYCDPHASFMNGSLTVTAAATTSTTAPTTTATTTAVTTTAATTTTATTETTTTATTTTAATTTVAAPAATARLTSWQPRATGRRVTVRIRVTAPAVARLRLLRGRRVLAGARRRVPAGLFTLRLAVPRRVPAGRYVLELRLVGPDGVARRYVRPLRLAAR